jgi:membrane protein YdbS with pleckstrin-like domain
LENLDADQVKAWADAVGPSFMAFVGFAMVMVFLIVPMVRRDKKEGGNVASDLSFQTRLDRIEVQHGILWKEWERRQK